MPNDPEPDRDVPLRDWFAGQAHPVLLAAYIAAAARGEHGYGPDWRHGIAADAYAHADAMLAVRKAGAP